MPAGFEAQRFFAKLISLSDLRGLNDPTVKRVILLSASVLLVAGLTLSLQRHPLDLASIDGAPLLAVFLLAIPLVVALNVAEYLLLGRLLGKKIRLVEGFEVTVIGAAANVLPLPGSTLVRMAGLKASGAPYRQGAVATVLVYVVWLGVASIYAGVWIALLGVGWVGVLFAAAGTLLLASSFFVATRLEGGLRVALLILATRLGLVVIEAFRIHLCLLAIGSAVSFGQASGLSVTGVLGSAFSIVPAGLGIREVIAAALSPVVGIAISAGFLATFVNRVLGIVFIIPLAFGLALDRRAQ